VALTCEYCVSLYDTLVSDFAAVASLRPFYDVRPGSKIDKSRPRASICTSVSGTVSGKGKWKSGANIAGTIDQGHCCEINEPLELEILTRTCYFFTDEWCIISVRVAFSVTSGGCGEPHVASYVTVSQWQRLWDSRLKSIFLPFCVIIFFITTFWHSYIAAVQCASSINWLHTYRKPRALFSVRHYDQSWLWWLIQPQPISGFFVIRLLCFSVILNSF
jgi:hypothetical protein